MFVQAGNLFKMCKKWQEAGGAYLKAAECNSQLQNKHEVASNYVLVRLAFFFGGGEGGEEGGELVVCQALGM